MFWCFDHLMLKYKYYVHNCMALTKYMLYIGIVLILVNVKSCIFILS